MAEAHRETYQETFDKLPPAEQARAILLERCSAVLWDGKTSPLVNSGETGKMDVFEVENNLWPLVSVDFGGTRNYQIVVSELLGPAHVGMGWNVQRVTEL